MAQFPIRIATSKEKESKTKSPLECVLYSADFTIGDLRLSQACMGIWRSCAILFPKTCKASINSEGTIKAITVDAKELEKLQAEMSDRINCKAKELGLVNEKCEPVTDGVMNIGEYLKTSPRIMWVLKEPWDDVDENGIPCGGGWDMSEAFGNDDAWKNRTWQPIIYASYGIINRCLWKQMDWIRDDTSMAEVLKRIAYINVSKMPGYTQSEDEKIRLAYSQWREILQEQIKMYEPQVIIFGYTFDLFKEDLVGGDAEPKHRDDGVIHVYEKEGVKLLDVYHPNQRVISREKYIDSIIEQCL